MLTLTQLAGGFEKLLSRLPGPIRKPVEAEWHPLQELFFKRRATRVLAVAASAEAARAWLDELFQLVPELAEREPGGWRTHRRHGTLQLAVAASEREGREAIEAAEPDLILFLENRGRERHPFALLTRLHTFCRERYFKPPPIVAAGEAPVPLMDALEREPALKGSIGAVQGISRREAILAAMAQTLPLEARLEFARFSGEKAAQMEIAALLTRSATAVCTAVGAQPIPLADFPVLTSLQVLMVSGIVHATGREWNGALVRRFLAALGANVGIGVLLREGARAAVKLLPGWGNAISGGVAGAGTYAIGRAASAYFIEGLPMDEARRRFRFFRRRKR